MELNFKGTYKNTIETFASIILFVSILIGIILFVMSYDSSYRDQSGYFKSISVELIIGSILAFFFFMGISSIIKQLVEIKSLLKEKKEE